VYAIDTRVMLEANGFSVLGGRQPDGVITTAGSAAALTFEVSNVAVANRIRVSSGEWSETRDLAPNERRLVRVPVSAQPAIVNIRVEQGAFVDGRFLGCRITIPG
jgi:hypothetical protein